MNWIKNHKLVVALLLVIAFLLFRPVYISPLIDLSSRFAKQEVSYPGTMGLEGDSSGMAVNSIGLDRGIVPYAPDAPPQTDVSERLVIENSYLSLLVKDVVGVRGQIVSFAESVGGYMVNSSISNPQDAPTAEITIRVPSARLEETLNHFRGLAIKVVSENLAGRDVTDQYVDVDKRIALLEATRARFEAILAKAEKISDITQLNQQIISIQSQIDNLHGQQESLKQNAALARMTVYLSTDEIALPYAPSETFRPQVIFKQAVRSLVSHVRKLASGIIWLGVYAVIWVPVLVGVWYVRRRMRSNYKN